MKLLFLEIKLENKSIAKIQIIFGTKKLFGKKLLKKLLRACGFLVFIHIHSSTSKCHGIAPLPSPYVL